jgi:tetratricopeptide (TPR) repeat protein
MTPRMDSNEELLKDIHREVLETRGATIKTDNAVKNLATEIRQLSDRQSGSERRAFFNSGMAYALFAILSFCGLFLFFRASMGRTRVEQQVSEQQRADTEQRASELESELERWRESSRAAYEFYELLSSGRSAEVVERWSSVQGRLTDRATIELFRREVERLRNELAVAAFELGVQNARNQRWEVARDAFTRSIAYVDVAPYSPELYYYLGESLYQLDDYHTAVRYFDLAIEADRMERSQAIIAYFHRAEALQRSDRALEAAEAYRLFIRRFDEHHWSSTARSRLARMEEEREQEEAPAQ